MEQAEDRSCHLLLQPFELFRCDLAKNRRERFGECIVDIRADECAGFLGKNVAAQRFLDAFWQALGDEIVNLGEQRAWRIAAGGAVALVVWWVLFILPNINLNVSFLATVGVAAAALAVWTSPGNPYQQATGSSSTS